MYFNICKTIGSDPSLLSRETALAGIFDSEFNLLDKNKYTECAGVKNSYASLIANKEFVKPRCIVLTRDTGKS